jgi:leader peptidase (prepilin peptidase)/N-methyltransferase
MWALLVGVLGWPVGVLAVHAAEALQARRALRVPTCPYCAESYAPLQWSAWLALLTGRWRCAACDRPRRWAHLVGEAGLALAWGGLVARHGLTGRTLLALLGTVPLVMVTVTDLETRLIPNRILLPALALMLVLGVLFGPAVPALGPGRWWYVPLGALLGFLVFWVLAAVGTRLFGEGALGMGDVKLAAYVGALVGYPLVVEALILTFFLGGVGGVLVLIARRGDMRSTMPYGPYLALAGWLVMAYGIAIFRWYLST